MTPSNDGQVLSGESLKRAGVVVSYVYPPIPTRAFDYSATFDGYDGAEDSGGGDGPNAIGHGETEAAAVRDLLLTAEEYIIRDAVAAWDDYTKDRPLKIDGKINDDALNIKLAGYRVRKLRERMERLRLLVTSAPATGA